MSEIKDKIIALQKYMEDHIFGQEDLIKKLIITMLADGHVLVEGAPGLAKTKAIKTMAQCINVAYNRIQFTPDLLPSDITGSDIFAASSGYFEFRPGPIFANLVLADEINRAPAKVQAALLEAMAERQVSVGGKQYKLQRLFMVMATQNPIEHEGTYNLPEAQLDRFMMKVSMGYPTVDQEIGIIASRQKNDPFDLIIPTCTKEDIITAQDDVKDTNIEPSVYRYIVEITASTRVHPAVELGASPRASLALMRAAQSYAFLNGRAYVVPEDVLRMTPYILPHRIRLTQEAKIKRTDTMDVLRDVIKAVKPPFTRGK